jgi:hypothetical protein
MKYIKQFESFRVQKNREEIIRESVLQVNDIYKVKTMIDIPQSLINSYVKKVKDTTDKNLRQFFGDVDIAEEIVKYITLNNTDVDKIPGNALLGGPQGQVQGQAQVVAETQPAVQTTQEVPQTQVQPAATQEVPQSTQEVPQSTQEVPQSTQETPQAVAQPSAQFEEPAQAQEGQAPVAQEEEEKEDEEEEELPL